MFSRDWQRTETGSVRVGHRPRRSIGGDPPGVEFALRRERDRSVDVRWRFLTAPVDRRVGKLASCAPRNQSRSDGGIAL